MTSGPEPAETERITGTTRPGVLAGLGTILRSRYFVSVTLGVGLALRLFWVAFVPAQPVSDCRWYFDRATTLAEGGGYAVDGRPTAFFPVGYPVFLAVLFNLFGPSLLAAKLANVAVQTATLLLAHHLAVRLFRSEPIGRLTLLLLAVYPNYIAHAALTCTESTLTAALLLAVFVQLKAVDHGSLAIAAAAGLTFGVASLIKPQVVLVPALVWGLGSTWMLNQRRRRLMVLGVMCMAMAVPLSVWTVRNHRVFGTLVFVSTNGGVNLLIGNNPRAIGKYLPLEVSPEDVPPKGELERDTEARRLALEFMIQQPAAMLKLWPAKLWHLYGRDGDGFDWNMAGISAEKDGLRTFVWRAAQVNGIYYWALMLMSGAGFVHFALTRPWLRGDSASAMLPFWLTALFTGVYLVYFGDPRFHFPVMPWVAMYSAWLISLLSSGQSGAMRVELASPR